VKFVPKRLEKTADISRGDTSWQSFVKNSLSAVIILALVYLALGLVADLLAHSIPDRWEVQLFDWTDFDLVESSEMERAKEIFSHLLERAELRDLPYRLYVIPGDDPNAFAFPGGAVGVTSGLLKRIESETGLATVLGHELGHHQARHPLKAIGRALIFRLAMSLAFGGSQDSLVKASLELAESRHSRRQETAADAFGLRLVHRVYGHTESSLEFFEQMRDEHGSDEHRWASFLRTHPLTEDRISDLRKLRVLLEE